MTTNKGLISETLARRMLVCVKDYEAIKAGNSETFSKAKDFCSYHGFSRQKFMKIYRRHKRNPKESSLLPQKRGPKFKTRRTDLSIEAEIIRLRELGNNRYEIKEILRSKDLLAPKARAEQAERAVLSIQNTPIYKPTTVCRLSSYTPFSPWQPRL